MAASTSRLIVSIEGNIASTKSTLLRNLKLAGYSTFPEPINLWTNVGGQPLLEMWYGNKPAYRHLLDTRIQLTMFDRDINLNPTGVNIIERSLFANRMVFSRDKINRSTDPSRNTIEEEINRTLFSTLIQRYPTIGLIIYLNSPPWLCYQRSEIRNRQAEKNGLHLDYIQRLDQYYRDWLIKRIYGYVPGGVRVIQVDPLKTETEIFREAKSIIT